VHDAYKDLTIPGCGYHQLVVPWEEERGENVVCVSRWNILQQLSALVPQDQVLVIAAGQQLPKED